MKKLVFWIFLSKLALLAIILFSGVPLMPDEAQYWTWSKELSYGYYSKPPAIAWQIAAGCALFGDSELGVRFGSFILSTVLSFAIYWLALGAGVNQNKSFWAALTFSFCPLGIFSGFFATTDCAYVLFWAIGAAIAIRDLEKGQPLSYVLLGAFIGLGALWKWPIYSLWIPVLLFFYRDLARVIGGMAISLLGLVPSLIWNMQHGFATFWHVKASIDSHTTRSNPLEFLGAQALLVSPVLFGLVVFGMIKYRKGRASLQFCWITALLFFATIFAASCFEKVQGNWAVACYPTAFVIMVLYANKRWLEAGVLVSAALVAAIFLLPIPYQANPFKQSLGVEKLSDLLLATGYRPASDFLFSDRYQLTSLLSFYGPEKRRAYFFNIHALRHNQFDYWPTMRDDSLDKTGYFVEFSSPHDAEASAERFKQKLAPFFSSIEILPFAAIYKDQKVAIILKAVGYNGKEPAGTNKY